MTILMLRWWFYISKLLLCIVTLGAQYGHLVKGFSFVANDTEPEPILILPGLMASTLYYERGNITHDDICFPPKEPSRLWVNVDLMTSWECFLKYMRLETQDDGFTKPVSLVNVTVPDDGIAATAYLDPDTKWGRGKLEYLHFFYEHMKTLGYTLHYNLDAVAYDWRKSPLDYFQTGQYFDAVKSRVEAMYQSTKKKISLVGHSMGGATGGLFLSSFVDNRWKKQYIKRFISVGGMFGGSLMTLSGLLDGLGIPVVADLLKKLAKYIPSVHALAPISNRAKPVWGNDTIFSIGKENYTTDMLPQLWERLGLVEFVNALDLMRDVGWQKPPGVETECIMSLNHPTVVSIKVKSTSFVDLDNPTFVYDEGDGTVPAKSLQICSDWSSKQHENVNIAYFESNHFDLIHADESVWTYIYDVVNPTSS